MNVLQAITPLVRTSKVITLFINNGVIKTSSRKVGLSGKVKSTVLEKWGTYWKDLIKDYTDVLKDTIEDSKKYPRKTLGILSLFGFVFLSCKTNPDDISYRENVLKCSNDVLLVGKAIRNPNTDQFLTAVENCYNLGVIRRLSFGIISVMWIDNYSSELGIFKAECSYLKPQYLTFSSRLIDIGFFGKWWKLEKIMKDYDINHEEWVDSKQ
uniref:Mitochondrial import inner membrane translocase subunit Tim29 n=1 Tax=Cuerna arida TaxID=1464854 RepID=A0A1B6H264_9HEMI